MAGFWKRLFVQEEPPAPAPVPAKSEDEVKLDLIREAIAGVQSQKNLLEIQSGKLEKEIQTKIAEFNRLADQLNQYPEDDPDCTAMRKLLEGKLEAIQTGQNELQKRVAGFANRLGDNESFLQKLRLAEDTLLGMAAPGTALDPMALATLMGEIVQKRNEWADNLALFNNMANDLAPSATAAGPSETQSQVADRLAKRQAKKAGVAPGAAAASPATDPATAQGASAPAQSRPAQKLF